MTLGSDCGITLGSMEEGTGEETEGGNEGEEDQEEDQVGTDGADEVDEAEYTHSDHEVC